MVSIIIPTHDEATRLPATLSAIARNTAEHEVVVVDAGTDSSADLARQRGARVVFGARRHRADQMNLGARHARGGALLFLHADTLLPPGALESILHAFEQPAVAGGGFARRYDSHSLVLRATCALAGLRTRWRGWFLGDQAIFVRRGIFERLGGFHDLDLFEDLDFSRRMSRLGRVVTLRPPVISSARRFQQRGVVATTWSDFWLTVRYLCGQDPNALAAGVCGGVRRRRGDGEWSGGIGSENDECGMPKE